MPDGGGGQPCSPAWFRGWFLGAVLAGQGALLFWCLGNDWGTAGERAWLGAMQVAVAILTALVVVGLLQKDQGWSLASLGPLRTLFYISVVGLVYVLSFANVYRMATGERPGFLVNGQPVSLDRVNAVYFTMTTMATVGFGDITPATSGARLFVTLQEISDLLLFGLGLVVLTPGLARQTGERMELQSPRPIGVAATPASSRYPDNPPGIN